MTWLQTKVWRIYIGFNKDRLLDEAICENLKLDQSKLGARHFLKLECASRGAKIN